MQISRNILIALLCALFLTLQSVYITDQWRCGIVTQFGDPIRIDMEPGLKFKVPFIQDVTTFDRRTQTIEFNSGGSSEVVASDQKTLILSAFTLYKITDPLAFYRAVNNESALHSRMEAIINSAIREVIGSVTFAYVLGVGREDIMSRIRNNANTQMKEFGVEILGVNITYFGLPEKAKKAVYERMILDRTKEATEIRASGKEQASIITATADRERGEIIALANKRAIVQRGAADANAARILSEAYSKDPVFFKLYRSLDMLDKAMDERKTSLVLSTDNRLLNVLSLK